MFFSKMQVPRWSLTDLGRVHKVHSADPPCIGTGTIIEDNGANDFFGNPVPSNRRPTLGVYEPSH